LREKNVRGMLVQEGDEASDGPGALIGDGLVLYVESAHELNQKGEEPTTTTRD
jgi:hypothetical protein